METIVAERSERFQAVNDLWAKLGELQLELNGNGAASRGAKPPPQEAMSQEVAQLRSFARSTAESNAETIAELRKAQGDQLKKLSDLEFRLSEFKTQAVSGGNHGRQRPEATDLFGSGSEGSFHDKFESLRKATVTTQGMVERLDERDREKEKEFAEMRTLIIQTYNSLPLHAVKASRVALKAVKMTADEIERALQALDQTEQKLRSSAGAAAGGISV